MCDEINKVGLSCILCNCDVHLPVVLIRCARVPEIDWRDTRCLGWFPYDFGTEKVEGLSIYKFLSGERDSEGDRRNLSERVVLASYHRRFAEDDMSRCFAECVYEL